MVSKPVPYPTRFQTSEPTPFVSLLLSSSSFPSSFSPSSPSSSAWQPKPSAEYYLNDFEVFHVESCILLSQLTLIDKMIKRRFYKLDHSNRDASDPSSSSDSEIEVEASEEESEDEAVPEVKQEDEAGSTSSGYESEDGSGNDVDVNSSGLLFSEDDTATINERQTLVNRELSSQRVSEVPGRKSNALVEKKPLTRDMISHVLQCKSVFKCRICPRIICLSEDTLRDHLQSKRHARSEKLLSEGRLKAMLNSDGEIEEQEVTEIQPKDPEDGVKKNHKGQKQHKKRMRRKKNDKGNTRKASKGSEKRRRKKDEN
ncbi:hypothetical protein RIF29_14030 [Crotalaria pallida]|uniref:C2H2-type domain-containing protein n=1 Tax=Crotalaria pallida TaxID=3830 RepID=A0AAN9FG60_CROPI